MISRFEASLNYVILAIFSVVAIWPVLTILSAMLGVRSGRVTGLAQGVDDLLGMAGIAGFDGDIELCPLGGNIQRKSVVVDLDDVAAAFAYHG